VARTGDCRDAESVLVGRHEVKGHGLGVVGKVIINYSPRSEIGKHGLD
jgi:hypothetical protein